MRETTQCLGAVERWLQREDDELLYTPDGDGQGEDAAGPAVSEDIVAMTAEAVRVLREAWAQRGWLVEREVDVRPVLHATGDVWRHPILPPLMAMAVVGVPLAYDACTFRICDTPHGALVCLCGQYRLSWEP
jgi:hypothetical protein